MKPSIVSGHQPLLFGTAGYWSKIVMADKHLVTACVPFRRHDKLASAELISGGNLAVPLSDGEAVSDVRVGALTKTIKSMKMEFGAKRMPFRSRLEPILAAFEDVGEGDTYLYLWTKMAMALLDSCRLAAHLAAVITPDTGLDTQERLENRIQNAVEGPVLYILGPGARGYIDRKPRYAMAVHRMLDPEPTPFLYDIVTLADPLEALKSYTLEALR